jgi:hypothetical protein
MKPCRSALLLVLMSIFVTESVAYANTTKTDKSAPSVSSDSSKAGRLIQTKTKGKAGQSSSLSGGSSAEKKYEGWQVIQNQGYIGTNQIYFCQKGVKIVNPLFLLIFQLTQDTVILANTQTRKALVSPSDKVVKYLNMMGYRLDKESELERKYKWSPWKKIRVEQKFGLNTGFWERQILNPPPYSSRKQTMTVATDFKLPRKLLDMFLRFTDNKNTVGFPLQRRTVIESPELGYKIYDELSTREANRVSLTDADLQQPKGYGLVKDFSELIYNDEGGQSLSQMAEDLKKNGHHYLPPNQTENKQSGLLEKSKLPKTAPNAVPTPAP